MVLERLPGPAWGMSLPDGSFSGRFTPAATATGLQRFPRSSRARMTSQTFSMAPAVDNASGSYRFHKTPRIERKIAPDAGGMPEATQGTRRATDQTSRA